MSEEFENLDEFEVSGSPAAVPNATAVLVLGILSIVTCWLYGIPGIIMGIIAISMHKKDKALYLSNKGKYEQSFKNSKAGFVCGIIGLCLSALWIIYPPIEPLGMWQHTHTDIQRGRAYCLLHGWLESS